MTSSLVGSEMCIRDSNTTLAFCSALRVDVDFAQGSGGEDTRVGALAIYPVSYTHLTLPTICSV
eukprot:122983-Prorocentrum_lima.AAC.1